MNAEHAFETIDAHTAGEPTRILVDGLEWEARGEDVATQRDRIRDELDWVRRLLVQEPRGHADMFGAYVTPPADPDAAFGLVFVDNDGYLDMCGHATIGAVTALVETGSVPRDEEVVVETPAGVIRTTPHYSGDSVEAVSVRNVPSFVHDRVCVDLEATGPIDVDVVSAGNLFALVDLTGLQYGVSSEDADALVDIGLALRERINRDETYTHPVAGTTHSVELVEFYETRDGVDRTLTVFGDGQIDRSPCGTGTCAKLALLSDRGQLSPGESYTHRSVIDTEFTGRIADVRSEPHGRVVVPELTGSAYVTGRHSFLLDPDDPLTGFRL